MESQETKKRNPQKEIEARLNPGTRRWVLYF